MLRSFVGCFVHTGLDVLQCSSELRYAESTGTVPAKCDGYKPSESSLKDSSGCQEHWLPPESKLQVLAACQIWFLAHICRAASSSSPQPSHYPKGCRTGRSEGTSAWAHTAHSCFKCTKTGVPLSQEVIFFPFQWNKNFFSPVLALLLSRHDL